MIEYSQLNKEEQDKIQKQGKEWFQEHKSHVYSLIEKETAKVAPSGSDMFRPELWKPMHWKWFLDNNFLL